LTRVTVCHTRLNGMKKGIHTTKQESGIFWIRGMTAGVVIEEVAGLAAGEEIEEVARHAMAIHRQGTDTHRQAMACHPQAMGTRRQAMVPRTRATALLHRAMAPRIRAMAPRHQAMAPRHKAMQGRLQATGLLIQASLSIQAIRIWRLMVHRRSLSIQDILHLRQHLPMRHRHSQLCLQDGSKPPTLLVARSTMLTAPLAQLVGRYQPRRDLRSQQQ